MKIILVLGVSLIFFSCKKEIKNDTINSDTTVKVAIDSIPKSDNSQNSLDWQGTYKGLTPCADCEGIETEIVLNLDLRYVMKTRYLGKGDGKSFVEKGSFIWDKSGGNITLNGGKAGSLQYKVGENQLIQLDTEGNVIEGNLAEKYILTK